MFRRGFCFLKLDFYFGIGVCSLERVLGFAFFFDGVGIADLGRFGFFSRCLRFS